MSDIPPPAHSSGSVAYAIYRLGRRISRIPVVRALIPWGVRAGIQGRLLPRAIDRLPDRRYMEEAILPAVAALQPRRLLDVGVEFYTRHYGDWFPADCERWTIDLNPGVAGHGSPGRHITGNVLDIAAHFAPGSIDVIMMNGPFGYGIDRVDEQERTIAAAQTVLKPGGWLLIGWDRSVDGTPLVLADQGRGLLRIKDPVELDSIRSGFTHTAPPGLPARMEFADCSHVYDWFRAREADRAESGG